MEKEELLKIAKELKKLGYIVYINGFYTRIVVGNGKGVISLNVLESNDELFPKFIGKELGYDYGIGFNDENRPHIKSCADITKEIIDKALLAPAWCRSKNKSVEYEDIKKYITDTNSYLTHSKLKKV